MWALAPEGLCARADGSDSGVVLLVQVKGLLRHITFALCDGAALIHTPPSHLLTAAPLRIPVSAGKQEEFMSHYGKHFISIPSSLPVLAQTILVDGWLLALLVFIAPPRWIIDVFLVCVKGCWFGLWGSVHIWIKKANKGCEILSFFTNVYFLYHVLSLNVVESVKEQMTQTWRMNHFCFSLFLSWSWLPDWEYIRSKAIIVN